MLLVLYCHSVLSIRSAFVVCYDFSPTTAAIAIDGGSCCFFFARFPSPPNDAPSFERALFGRLDKSDFYRDYKTFNLFFYERQTYFPGLRHKFHGRLRAARVQKNALYVGTKGGRKEGGACDGSVPVPGRDERERKRKEKNYAPGEYTK